MNGASDGRGSFCIGSPAVPRSGSWALLVHLRDSVTGATGWVGGWFEGSYRSPEEVGRSAGPGALGSCNTSSGENGGDKQ